MPDTPLWQRLFDAVKVRFQAIHTNNGYQTDVGQKCFAWRDLNKSPFTLDDAPCIMVRDPNRETSVLGVITAHDHTLTIEVYACAMAPDSSPPDNFARLILCDLDQAIGVDRQWTVDGVKLARDTLPGSDAMETVHTGDRIIGVRKTFTIIFRTRAFDPYNQ